MSLSRKYYEDLYINSSDDRELLQQNQDLIIEMLNANGAVGVFGLFTDEADYPIYFISGFSLTALGYGSYDELMQVSGGKFLELIYEKDKQAFLERAEAGTLDGFDFRVIHSSGKSVWVKWHCRASHSYDMRPIEIGSIRVIEDSKKRESELLEALTKSYRTIFYVDMNEGRYRMIKSEADWLMDEHLKTGTISELREILNRYGRDYISPEDHSFSQVLNELDFTVDPGELGGSYQAVFQADVNGKYQWTQFQAFYGGAMNLDTGHFILTFKDVDAEKRKELDTNRILSDSLEKAAEASRIKNRFLTRMSHDLRTPINGIVGMLEIAGRNRGDCKVMEECLDKITLSCDTLISLVQDLLDLNQLENSEIELVEEDIILHDLLSEKSISYHERARRSGFSYATDFDESLRTNVISSPNHVIQIFDHIMDNAMKYNKPKGSILFHARELSRGKKMVTYEFVIEDTGIGMSPEFVEKIFEPFEQEHGEVRTEYIGTGLGMSIVKKLVDQMHGVIEVDSQQDYGTKVSMIIPFRLSEDAAVPEIRLEDVDFTGVRVLLAEDNEMNMEIARYLLENAGMKVTEAVNGQEAVEAFERSKIGEFQIVLMDIMMPLMDGLKATGAIRRMDRPDAKSVHIIALSANTLDSDIKKAKMAGMDDYQTKPIDTELLLGSIARCLLK